MNSITQELYKAIEEVINEKLNCKVIFRPHRGGLAEAMKEAKEYNSIQEMLNEICNEHNYRVPWFTITSEELYIEKQKIGDERVGWHNLFYITYERPSKIKNLEGYKKYFGISDDDVVFEDDFPCGVIGMFSTDYGDKISKHDKEIQNQTIEKIRKWCVDNSIIDYEKRFSDNGDCLIVLGKLEKFLNELESE